MIRQKLKIQNDIKASAVLKHPQLGEMRMKSLHVFSNPETDPDNTVLMVLQDTNNPHIQIHIEMQKK